MVSTHIATAIAFGAGGLLVGFKLGQRSRATPTTHIVALRLEAPPRDPDGTGPS